MAQQPNIELRDSDLPRPEAGPNPERRWTPDRPGDVSGAGVPWGGAFGTPGPDAGYAIKLAAGRELLLTENEHRADANLALAAVAAKIPELPRGSRILTFCYDTGERYLSVEDLFAPVTPRD